MIGFIGTLLENAPDWLDRLRPALLMTLAVTAAGFAGAAVLAIGLEIARESRFKAARWATRGLIDFVRCVPILTILYLLYFGLPGVGITLSSFVAGTVGLALVYSTYIAEVLRGGVAAIHHGQREAAIAAGFTPLLASALTLGDQANWTPVAWLSVGFVVAAAVAALTGPETFRTPTALLGLPRPTDAGQRAHEPGDQVVRP